MSLESDVLLCRRVGEQPATLRCVLECCRELVEADIVHLHDFALILRSVERVEDNASDGNAAMVDQCVEDFYRQVRLRLGPYVRCVSAGHFDQALEQPSGRHLLACTGVSQGRVDAALGLNYQVLDHVAGAHVAFDPDLVYSVRARPVCRLSHFHLVVDAIGGDQQLACCIFPASSRSGL